MKTKYKPINVEDADALYMMGVELEWKIHDGPWNKDTYVEGACPPARDNSKGLKWRVRVE